MLYGRDPERARIGALLEAARESRSGVLVLRGEAGIGKSALLEDARDRAGDMHVLSARGVESESELPFAALHQLLRPALDSVDGLPAPQAAALRSALGLEGGAAPERFLVFAACLTLLSDLAERRPVLCLVDDAHWLDAASSEALQFVARRLDAEGIVLLFAAREGEARGFDAAGVPSLPVGGLDPEAAAVLLDRGTANVAPSVREHLVAQSRGNALALVELPSVLTTAQLAGDEPLPDALPLSRQLEQVFSERVRRLPEDAQVLLLLAAADGSEDVRAVTAAGRVLGAESHALNAAEDARLITVHGNRLEFRHPLVRSAVYGAATSNERRAAHAALAAALADDEQHADHRAWHLAASALEHDEDVVRELEEAAQRAEQRAGYVAAARALERAAELSSAGAARGGRLVRAARNLSLAGRNREAVLRADEAAPFVTDPALRADLAEVRGRAAVRAGRPHEVVPQLVESAREVAAIDPGRAFELLMNASIASWQGGNLAAYLEVARLASTVVPTAGDEAYTAIARSYRGYVAMVEGETSTGLPLLRETVAWGATADKPIHALWAAFASFWLGDAAGFGKLAERAEALARELGDVGTLAEPLGMRSTQLAVDQRFDEASVTASEALGLARDLGAENLELLPRTALAIVAAVQGRDDDARDAEEVLKLASDKGLQLRVSVAVYALALGDLGRARWADAFARLDALRERESSAIDPMVGMTLPDKIEAAVRAGKPEAARALLPELEARAGYSGLASLQPRLAACRALLADGDEATEHFEHALRLRGDARPLDLARIQLLYGEHLRRARRRSDARVHLRAAIEGFEHLRAEPWAERARTELRASGETARRRDPSTMSKLTPQELQIARLVAQGLPNKEIAAQLFLSPRTVDSHLRNIFGKLELTSRMQLARIPLGDEPLPASA